MANFKKSFYIAAPFFNAEQVRIVQMIENALRDAGHMILSPRLQHEGEKVEIKNREQALAVLAKNKQWIADADILIACIDWACIPGQEVRMVIQGSALRGYPLNIPDAGTCWEIGYAHAIQKPVVLWTKRAREDKINVMLAAPAEGVIYGPEGLLRFSLDGFSALTPFDGRWV